MNITFFLLIIFILSTIYISLGLLTKKAQSTDDYFLANGKLNLLPVTFSLIATQLGGGMLLGTTQQAYYIGYYGILYTLGISIGFLLLGFTFASKLQSLNVTTTAQLFETCYKSPNLKKLASILSIITMLGLLIGQIIGLKMLFTGIGITNELLLIILWIGIVIHTMTGGLEGVIITDTFQVGFIIIIFSSIFLYSIYSDITFFTLSGLFEKQALFNNSTTAMPSIIGTVLMPALFCLIEQDLAQRFFACKTKKIAKLSAIYAGLFLLLFSCVPLYFGIKAKILNLSFSGSPLIPVITYLTNNTVLTIAICGIVAAIVSTADSLLCAISSNIAQDFSFSTSKNINSLYLSKLITLTTGAIAFILSYLVPQNIISILIGSYELSVACLLVPLIFAYFNKDLNKNAALGAIITGFISFIIFTFFYPIILKEILTIILSIAGFYIGNKIK